MKALFFPLFLTAALAITAEAAAAGEASAEAAPRYTADGKLTFPAWYRQWVFLTSGVDMSYSKIAMDMGGSMFDNVFVPAEAYREFLRTGTWPEHTVIVKEARAAAQKGSINRHGKFQTSQMMGVEAHVKDSRRFSGGWAFFDFQGNEPAARIPEAADCYSCHRQHGAVDSTFVQFYPTLMSVAVQKHTLAPGFKP
jgi:hypothetical protein